MAEELVRGFFNPLSHLFRCIMAVAGRVCLTVTLWDLFFSAMGCISDWLVR